MQDQIDNVPNNILIVMADMDAKVGTKNEDFESLWANKTREWNEEINKALTETGTTITGHQTV